VSSSRLCWASWGQVRKCCLVATRIVTPREESMERGMLAGPTPPPHPGRRDRPCAHNEYMQERVHVAHELTVYRPRFTGWRYGLIPGLTDGMQCPRYGCTSSAG
jgi:hypothetical protein